MHDPHLNHLLWRVTRMTEDDFEHAAERWVRTMHRLASVVLIATGRHQMSKWLRRNRTSWVRSFDRLDDYLATTR